MEPEFICTLTIQDTESNIVQEFNHANIVIPSNGDILWFGGTAYSVIQAVHYFGEYRQDVFIVVKRIV